MIPVRQRRWPSGEPTNTHTTALTALNHRITVIAALIVQLATNPTRGMPTLAKSPLGNDAYLRVETPRHKPVTSSESDLSESKKEPSLRRQIVDGGPTSFKFTHLYRYATPLDKWLLL
ncbi:hypothetical protein PC123_g25116, partial [Phytophthora cactorum]